ncbi:MAG: DciA family protein [Patescibacteria group bacterium]|jgi:hypothetical protein
MDKIEKLLMGALNKKGLAGAATSSHACFLAEKWGKGRLKAISCSRGILKVSVSSSAAAQELSMDEEELLSHINVKMGRECVKRLRIINSD